MISVPLVDTFFAFSEENILKKFIHIFLHLLIFKISQELLPGLDFLAFPILYFSGLDVNRQASSIDKTHLTVTNEHLFSFNFDQIISYLNFK